jgi:hypothetical protein
VSGLELGDLMQVAVAFAELEGASSGLLGFEDLQEAAAALELGTSATVIVWENRWAAPVAAALRRSASQLVASGRLPVQAIWPRSTRSRPPTDSKGSVMPGLLREVTRSAVIAGTATAVSNRVSRWQAERWQRQGRYPDSQPQQAAYQQASTQYEPEPQPEPQVDLVQQLKDLAEPKDQGLLTEEESAAQKARILSG